MTGTAWYVFLIRLINSLHESLIRGFKKAFMALNVNVLMRLPDQIRRTTLKGEVSGFNYNRCRGDRS